MALSLSRTLLLASSLAACSPTAGSPVSPASSSSRAASTGPQGEAEPRASAPRHRDSSDDSNSRSETIELRHERSSTSWLGVELRATEPEVAGVQIVRVMSGSPAEKARLVPGDLLTSIGESPVSRPSDVGDLVRKTPPGSSLPVGFLRQGQAHLVRIQFEGMPDFEDRLRLAFVGRKAPEIHGVVTFQGEAATLKELRGQVVVLEFWASFCQVCRVMAPMLDHWARTYAPQGALLIGITVDHPEKGLEAAQRAGMSYALASDPEAEVTRKYLASQIPTLIVIDKNGVVRDAMVGYSSERLGETQELIERLLKESS